MLLAEVPTETRLAMKHEGSDVVAMRTTVGAAAKLTVAERDHGIAKFERYDAALFAESGPISAADDHEAAEVHPD